MNIHMPGASPLRAFQPGEARSIDRSVSVDGIGAAITTCWADDADLAAQAVSRHAGSPRRRPGQPGFGGGGMVMMAPATAPAAWHRYNSITAAGLWSGSARR